MRLIKLLNQHDICFVSYLSSFLSLRFLKRSKTYVDTLPANPAPIKDIRGPYTLQKSFTWSWILNGSTTDIVKFIGTALDPLVDSVALKCPKKTLRGKEDPVDIFAKSGIAY